MEISILFLPLIASIISGFFGKYIGDRNSEILTSVFVSISAILSIFVLYQVIVNQYEENIVIATWINSGSLDVNWSMLIDPLSAVMLVVVTSVSSLVHIYSIGYMSHDPHKPRFMAYLSLFTFAMLAGAEPSADHFQRWAPIIIAELTPTAHFDGRVPCAASSPGASSLTSAVRSR